MIVPAGIQLLILSSCKKQNSSGISNTGIVTNGNWKLTSFTISTITGSTDLYNAYSECRKDDYLHFNRVGTEEVNEGPAKCDSTDPQSHLIQWLFTNNAETKIRISGNNYIIDRLDNNNFQIHTLSTDPYAADETKTYVK